MTHCSPVVRDDLCLYRGDSFGRSIQWTDAEGNPIDLTGYAAKLQVRANVADASPILEISSENAGEITIDGPNGMVTYLFNPTQSRTIPDASVYDLELTSGSGDVVTLTRGQISVVDDITRTG